MTDATEKRLAELDSDDDDDITVPSKTDGLFRDASSSPDLPPIKRAKAGTGISTPTKAQESDSLDNGSETEASAASTDAESDYKLVS